MIDNGMFSNKPGIQGALPESWRPGGAELQKLRPGANTWHQEGLGTYSQSAEILREEGS